MAIYRTTIYKEFNGAPFLGERWSNVYWVNAIDVSAALSVGVILAGHEMAVSYTPIRVTSVNVVDPGNPADRGSQAMALDGDLDPTGLGGALPLFNTIRVRFTGTIQKPEQKYLRLGANTANIGSGTWDSEFVTFVQTNYADEVAGMISVTGPDGDDIVSGVALAPVQNRQLSWHRRTRPGFRRGWVAV